MSYLTLAKGVPNFSKAVISLWFRVPKASVVAAANHSITTGDFSVLQSVLPLMTFGAPQTSKVYTVQKRDVANWMSPVISPPPFMADYYVEGPSYDVDPSLIGIVCAEDGKFNLVFNVQTANHMPLSATGWITTKMSLWSGDDPAAPTDTSPGSGYVSIGLNVGKAEIADASYVDNAQPEFFTVISSGYYDPDEWHHLLLSFDISGSVSLGYPFASSSCRLWYAIDDVDFRGAENLEPYRASFFGPDTLDANAILTQNAWRLSGDADPADPNSYLHLNIPVPLPSGTYSGGSIPSKDAALGLPASVKYVDGIFRCEMAELQFYTGVTLDTGIETNRRAFIDNDGKPVDPAGTADDPRGPAEILLGVKPIIMLHGNSNWQEGRNTGSLGVEIPTAGDEVILPDGQFVPTAKIEKFKPEPELDGTA